MAERQTLTETAEEPAGTARRAVRTVGYYEDRAVSRSFPGEAGAEKMQGIMAGLASLGGRRVERIRDVQRGVSFDPARPSEQTPLSLPKSDVLQFFLEGGTTVSARPSGTEPKIKFYINCAVPAAGGGLAAAKTAAAAQCEAIQAEIGRILA